LVLAWDDAAVSPTTSPGGDLTDSGDLLAPVRLLLGDEELLLSRSVADVVTAAKSRESAAEVRHVQAGDLMPVQLDELLGPSLFGGERVVVVHAGQDGSKELTAGLLSYAKDPVDGTVLVIEHSGGAKQKALVEGLRGAGAVVVPCAKLSKPADRLSFVRAEISRAGGKASRDVANLILDSVGNDMRELATACAQLVADSGGTVDAAAVQRYHRGRAEVTGFTVADAAVGGNTVEALQALRWAESLGVAPVLIADALADGVRTIARVSGRRGSAYQLAGQLGMPPWKVERAQRQGRGWTDEALATAMQVAAALNADVKGVAYDEQYALERAVLAIAAAKGAR
jgi:DNA polymerase-3 subunit delta